MLQNDGAIITNKGKEKKKMFTVSSWILNKLILQHRSVSKLALYLYKSAPSTQLEKEMYSTISLMYIYLY